MSTDSRQLCFARPLRGIAPTCALAVGLCCLSALSSESVGNDLDELRVKREDNFELAVEPTLTPRGDQLEIAFTPRAYCDATIAIEDASGRIICHLASGVLGPKAPAARRWQASATGDLGWEG